MAQEIVVLAFDRADRAEEMLLSIRHLQEDDRVLLDDAVIVTKNEWGGVRLHQNRDVTAKRGAGWGTAGSASRAHLLDTRGGVLAGMAYGALVARLNDAGPC